MDNKNLLMTIRVSYNQFTRTEKKIADYVLKCPTEVPYMSISELADECHVADASVNRFCRTLKVRGYQEFKLLISTSIQADMVADGTDNASVYSSGNHKDFYDEILENHINAIRETNALLDHSMVDKTVRMMSEARKIIFVGVGNSMTTAEEAQGRFVHITPKVQYILDPHMQAMAASMVTNEDMLVFISYSGATADNVYVAQLAKARGAKIAVITRYQKSELTTFADTVLLCGSKEGPLEGGSMGAKMSQLHIIDVLFQCYYRANLEESRKNNRLTADSITNKYTDHQINLNRTHKHSK